MAISTVDEHLGYHSKTLQACLTRCGFTLLLLMATVSMHPQNAYASESCDSLSFETGLLNTDDSLEGQTITVIGHFPDHNYVVVVPGRRDSLLTDVRRYVPDAFMASSRLGAYVHAGAFKARGDAESLSMRLRSCNIRSRVVYFRNGRPI